MESGLPKRWDVWRRIQNVIAVGQGTTSLQHSIPPARVRSVPHLALITVLLSFHSVWHLSALHIWAPANSVRTRDVMNSTVLMRTQALFFQTWRETWLLDYFSRICWNWAIGNPACIFSLLFFFFGFAFYLRLIQSNTFFCNKIRRMRAENWTDARKCSVREKKIRKK